MRPAAPHGWRSTGESRATISAPPRMRGRTPSFRGQRSSAAPITRAPSPRCAAGSRASGLFVVVLVVIILIVVVAPHRSRGLGACRAGFRRHDDGAGLHLRTRVEDDDGLAGGAQQPLFLEHLQYPAGH